MQVIILSNKLQQITIIPMPIIVMLLLLIFWYNNDVDVIILVKIIQQCHYYNKYLIKLYNITIKQRVSKSFNTNININSKHNINNFYNKKVAKLYNATITKNSM